MQRTRCYYFTDTAFPACNKRKPGSGCDAVVGFNRIHAILGQTDQGPTSPHTCIATNPSDMNVALYALNATVELQGPKGKRTLPVRDFHRLPGEDPTRDTDLRPDELITAVTLPANTATFAHNSWYLKARDRQSYAFALVSVAAGLELEGDTIKSAGLALGGVAHKPWHSPEAEHALIGKPATEATFRQAADLALRGAKGYKDNTFKIQLAKNCIVRALTQATKGTHQRVSSWPTDTPVAHLGVAFAPLASALQATPPRRTPNASARREIRTSPQAPATTPPLRRRLQGHRHHQVRRRMERALPQEQAPLRLHGPVHHPQRHHHLHGPEAAERAPGVVAVLTPFNAPKLKVGKPQPPAKRALTVLQDPDVDYNGQPIAVVLAESLTEAMAAARLLNIKYAPKPAKLDFPGRLDEARPPRTRSHDPNTEKRGDVDQALASAEVKLDETYITPIQNHNPMEPHGSIAWWEGEKLNVYDTTQYISGDSMSLSRILNVAMDDVHVMSPIVGGGFGSKGSTWSHVILCAMAAKIVQARQAHPRPRADVRPRRRPPHHRQSHQDRRQPRRQNHRHQARRHHPLLGPRRLHRRVRRPRPACSTPPAPTRPPSASSR